jgi:hypothetical protein
LKNGNQFNDQAYATPDNKGEAVPENWGKQNEHWGVDVDPAIYRLNQHRHRSVPACNSLGCKTDSMAYPPDYAVTVSNWGNSNEHWQATDSGSVGEKNLANLAQLRRRSVPACTSLGCSTDSMAYPYDYAVTVSNWGNSNEHWQPTDSGSVGEKNLVQLESIPTCTSFECLTGTAAQPFKGEKPDGHPVDYSVPNFGTDKEMISDANNLVEAEKNLGKWDYVPASVAWKLNYRVPNFGVDTDIADTQESEKSTSDQLGIKWEPTQDANGVWTVPQPFDNRSYSYKE